MAGEHHQVRLLFLDGLEDLGGRLALHVVPRHDLGELAMIEAQERGPVGPALDEVRLQVEVQPRPYHRRECVGRRMVRRALHVRHDNLVAREDLEHLRIRQAVACRAEVAEGPAHEDLTMRRRVTEPREEIAKDAGDVLAQGGDAVVGPPLPRLLEGQTEVERQAQDAEGREDRRALVGRERAAGVGDQCVRRASPSPGWRSGPGR